MYTPSATYRVQLSSSFTLQQLEEVVDYLHELGVSTVYASPIFQARSGSTHGYDVANPLRISSDIGTEEEIVNISQQLSEHGMAWLQDIVPNHMAYDTVNPWIDDVLEKGQHSSFATYFDIHWEHPNPRYHGKIMAPFLGASLDNVLNDQQLTINWSETGFRFAYYDHQFPLSVPSYSILLREAIQSGSLDESNQAVLQPWIDRTEAYTTSLLSGHADDKSWENLKLSLFTELQQHDAAQEAIQKLIDQYPQQPEQLSTLLEQQNFRLVHWKTTENEINYRRFFTVNDLICLNAQHPDVFEHYHRKIKEWVKQEYVQGVRIDHVDGLFNPTGYLTDLRALLGSEAYITVEKILEHNEHLPDDWPIQGSSGYEFLADVNQLLTNTDGGKSLLTYYATWSPELTDYEALVYRNKSFVLHNRMQGELNNLMTLLAQSDILPAEALSSERNSLKEALAHLLIAFPVYRIYSTAFPFAASDRQVLNQAFSQAMKYAPALSHQLDQLREVFWGEASDDATMDQRRLHFVMRFQQFAGPLAAKGVEDTTFYVYHPLISHNEVGDSPHVLGTTIDTFHSRMQQRAPRAMNTTATHDTKRGEDARMRINLLSEIPSEWMKETARWRYANEPYKSAQDDHVGWPEANFEYFIYQTMVGTYPFHATPEEEDYEARLKAFLKKAAREAKAHTTWAEPNEAYEKSIDHFVTRLLQDEDFMDEFVALAKPNALMAVTYSLGQILLKVTAPGIPDVYQGTEFWDLSMVDPDNRRPVNYAQRQEALQRLETPDATHHAKLLQQLIGNLHDASIKLYVLSRSLQLRRSMNDVFIEGNYQPLVIRGAQKQHLLAFRRSWHQQEVIVLIPLGIANLSLTNFLPLGETCWKDTEVLLPSAENTEWRNVFTQQMITATDCLPVRQVLQDFPVALLTKTLL